MDFFVVWLFYFVELMLNFVMLEYCFENKFILKFLWYIGVKNLVIYLKRKKKENIVCK